MPLPDAARTIQADTLAISQLASSKTKGATDTGPAAVRELADDGLEPSHALVPDKAWSAAQWMQLEGKLAQLQREKDEAAATVQELERRLAQSEAFRQKYKAELKVKDGMKNAAICHSLQCSS